jgi:hypothetical protein
MSCQLWKTDIHNNVTIHVAQVVRCKCKVKCKVVSVLNSLCTKPRRRIREWRQRSTILDLGSRWRWLVSFTLLLWEKGVWYPLDRRLCGPHRRSGRFGVEKNIEAHSPYTAQWLRKLRRYIRKNKSQWFFYFLNVQVIWQSALVKTCFIRGKKWIQKYWGYGPYPSSCV